MKMLNSKSGPGVTKSLKFSPSDFAAVIAHLPEGCPLVGGQAVAWWAARYGLTGQGGEPITSGNWRAPCAASQSTPMNTR